jgi:hypothetical protein
MVVFQCARCGKEFNDKSQYYNHVDKQKICNIILRDIFPNYVNFIELDRKFECEYCHKEFELKYYIKNHHNVCKNHPNNIQEQIQEEQTPVQIQEPIPAPVIVPEPLPSHLLFNTFDGLIEYFEGISEKRKGTLFEIFCKHVLLYRDTDKTILSILRHSELTEDHKRNLNISTDKGIDLIIFHKIGTSIGVQCKYRTDIKKVFSYEDISTFLGQLYITYVHSGIFMTSVERNCKELASTNKITKYNYDYFKELDNDNVFYTTLFNDSEFVV